MFVACNKPDGYDNADKYTAVYEVLPDEYDNLDARVNNTIASIRSLFSAYSFTRTFITRDENRITVTVYSRENPTYMFNLIGQPAVLEFKGENSASAENLIVGSEHIEEVYITRDDNDKYAIGLKFNEQGKEKFAKVTGDYLNRTIYVYVDGELYTQVNVNSQITDGTAIITNAVGYTYQVARDFVTRLQSGALGVKLKLVEIQEAYAPADNK